MTMKINDVVKTKALDLLKNSENKEQALFEVIDMVNSESHKDLIEELKAMNEDLEAGRVSAKNLGLRLLNAEEKEFYNKLKAQDSVSFTQEDVIPTTVIDVTLESVKTASDTLKLVNMAPAGVQKWLVGSKTGSAVWGELTDALGSSAELTATITAMNINVNKLYVYALVPKAIRELNIQVIDKYFSAILAEAMHDGLCAGYVDGDGKVGPIGILRQINVTDTDGTKKAKTISTAITNFKSKTLAPVKKALSNNGLRKVGTIYIIANPADVADYVDPALYYFNGNGYVQTAKGNFEVIEEPMMPQGTAAFTIAGEYTMGMDSISIQEYKETKAMDDADLFVGKCNANGRATDDNVAYVFDVTKLVEFVPEYKSVA